HRPGALPRRGDTWRLAEAAEHPARQRRHHDLPGPADLIDAAYARGRPDHRSPDAAPKDAARRGPRAREGNAGLCPHPRECPAPEAISPRTVWRHAPAGDD